MAWPFATAVAPNFDTGPGIAVPHGSVTTLMTGVGWLLGTHLTNPTSTESVVTITDTAGTVICEVIVPGGGEQPYEWPFRPVNGVKISASVAGSIVHMWGYQ